ncbi:DUF3429 domain-containing protein [Oceaniradius stylonematis]|uniref:DUF3429 domain-containing protein n=1 Tax=Oceaniradius stylonematis TaxID=2184161 RepID=UPI0035CF8FDC
MVEDEDAEQIASRAPFMLALLGFVPFAVLTGAQFVPGATLAQTLGLTALNVYAAIILSFLGGIRWGMVVNAPDQQAVIPVFLLSVVPSLWAWAAFFAPGPWASSCMRSALRPWAGGIVRWSRAAKRRPGSACCG